MAADRIALVNQRPDDLGRYLASGRWPHQLSPARLDFKALRGDPSPPSTHQCDAWSHGAAWRLFARFEGEVFVIDRLGLGLHSPSNADLGRGGGRAPEKGPGHGTRFGHRCPRRTGGRARGRVGTRAWHCGDRTKLSWPTRRRPLVTQVLVTQVLVTQAIVIWEP